MNTKERYEVYRTNNLPLPSSTKHNILLLVYDLETEMLMVWRERELNFRFYLKAHITYVIIIISVL